MATTSRAECAQKLMDFQGYGFSTIDGRLFWREDIPGAELMRMFRTNWTCNGLPVIASASVKVDEHDPFNGNGDFSTFRIDFRTIDPNIPKDYEITKQLMDQQLYLVDFRGNTWDFKQAYDAIRGLCFTASLFPHVLMCDEMIEFEEGKRRHYGQGSLLISDYLDQYLNTYLPEVQKALMNEIPWFVGQITDMSDMHIAYDSAKQFRDSR